MTATTKRTSGAAPGDATMPGADVKELSGMHVRASRLSEELLEEVRTLRRAGRIREARGVEKRAQQVDQLLGALEGEVRAPPRTTN
jgi:hypothetical protein